MLNSRKPQSANPATRPRPNLGAKSNNFVGQGEQKYNIAAIMKKFKHESSIPLAQKRDKEVTSFPMNTLGEPNNTIPEWEAGGEERKEVSQTLRQLRQNYDKVHKTVVQRKQELEDLKRKLAKTTEEELYYFEQSQVPDNAANTADELERLQEEHAFEMMT